MSWVAVAVVGAGATVAGGIVSASAAGKEERQQDWLANPEYPHSQDARDLWWQKLQDWGNDPNYGAVSPDWDNIWNETQRKVKQFYDGGPLAPGVKDRLKSSLARRGMSDNPASDFQMLQTDAQQAQDLQGLNVEQNLQRTNFTNSGRDAWLGSLERFQAQKPAGQWDNYTTDPGAQQKAWGNLISSTGSAAMGASMGIMSQNNQNAFLNDLLKQNQMTPQSFGRGLIYGGM